MKTYKVKAIKEFNDAKENVKRKKGDEFVVDEERYAVLIAHEAVNLIEEIEEEKNEEKKIGANEQEIVYTKPKKRKK